MSLDNIYNAHFLEGMLPKPSIRGIPDPHLISFSKFLFMDHDISSFLELKNYSEKSSYVDELTFFYGLSCLFFESKYDKLIFKDELKKLKFKSNLYKKLLSTMKSFIDNPNKKYLDAINQPGVSEPLKSFCLGTCLKLAKLDLKQCYLLFPEQLKTLDIINDDQISIINLNDLEDSIDKFSFFYLSFMTKFYNYFTREDLSSVTNLLFDKKTSDAFLFHLYLMLNISDDTEIDKVLEGLKEYISTFDPKIVIGLSHYLLIYNFFNKNYNYIITWFNQFSGTDVVYDDDSNVNWNLDDLEFNPVSYSNFQLNSRFYINCLHHLVIYIQNNNKFYSDSQPNEYLFVYGGFHALSWSHLSVKNLSTKTFFDYDSLYDNFHIKSFPSSFIKNLNNNKDSSGIIPLTFNLVFDNNGILNVKSYIKDILQSSNNKNIYFLTLPLIIFPFKNLSSDGIIDLINSTNHELKLISEELNCNLIDINSYCDIKDGLIKSTNLLNLSLIKPEIITKVINSELV